MKYINMSTRWFSAPAAPTSKICSKVLLTSLLHNNNNLLIMYFHFDISKS